MKKILIILTIAIITSSCKLLNDYVKPQKKDIYALVYDQKQNGGTDSQILIYKNGEPTTISKSNDYRTWNYPTAMKIKGNDIYIAGYSGDYYNYNTIKFWKNGIETKLTDGTTDAYPNDIDFINNEVFISGSETKKNNNGNDVHFAKYWSTNKTQNLTEVKTTSYDDIAKSVILTTKDIHIIGNEEGNATYWKNGKANKLSTGAEPTSFLLNGSDVHIVGTKNISYDNNTGQSKNKLKYWKNGNEIDITDGTSGINNPQIAINGNDVYIAWQDLVFQNSKNTYRIKLWKNGITTTITEKLYVGIAALQIVGTDVYIAGNTYDDKTGKRQATYWKNGEEIKLGPNSSYKTSIVSFIIK